MKLNLLILLLASNTLLWAQNTVNITFRDIESGTENKITAYLLYNQPGSQKPADSVSVQNSNKLTFRINESFPKGLYSIMFYANDKSGGKQGKFDFLYSKNDIELSTSIHSPKDSIFAVRSDINSYYFNFLKQKEYFTKYFTAIQQLQSLTNPADTFAIQLNKQVYNMLNKQKRFMDTIRADTGETVSAKYCRWQLQSEIYSNEMANKAMLKNNFLKRFDFYDPLIKTGDLLARITSSYLFLFKDEQLSFAQQQDTLIKAIDNMMQYYYADEEIVGYVAETLLTDFKQIGMEKLVIHITENYLLPATCSDPVAEARLKQEVERLQQLQPGHKAPSFEINIGETGNLYDIKKQNTIVVFWASWCSHCRQILPEIHNALKNNTDVQVVAIALDEDTKEWQQAKAKYPGWLHLRAKKMWDDELVNLYAIYATPTIYVLNKDMMIVAKPKNLLGIANSIKLK